MSKCHAFLRMLLRQHVRHVCTIYLIIRGSLSQDGEPLPIMQIVELLCKEKAKHKDWFIKFVSKCNTNADKFHESVFCFVVLCIVVFLFEFFILSLQMVFKIFNVSSFFYRAALEKKTAGMVSAALPVRAAEKLAPAQYIRYTPSQQVKNVYRNIQRVIQQLREPNFTLEMVFCYQNCSDLQ